MQNILLNILLKRFLPQIAIVAAGAVLAIGGYTLAEECIIPSGELSLLTE